MLRNLCNSPSRFAAGSLSKQSSPIPPGPPSRMWMIGQPRVRFSSSDSSTSAAASSSTNFKNKAERMEYILKVNSKMEDYHRARDMMKSGKLKNKNYYRKEDGSVVAAQLGIAALFLVAFTATPFLGRKIAQDKEFREKYIPSWYDYTIKKERGWTRDEINAQMMQVEMNVRRRAAAGEFAPEKLQALQKRLENDGGGVNQDLLASLQAKDASDEDIGKIRSQLWDKPNPALEKGESYNESSS